MWKMQKAPGLILGLGRSPGGGHGNPLQYYCLENPHGQRSLAGYSPWGLKESDTAEVINMHTHSQLTGNVAIVSGEQQRDSAKHAHICILPQTLLPFIDFISIFSKLPCFTT